ncbi:MAG: hypothetical protein WCI94_21750, partial [Rhodospirillales bacterium]
DYAERSGLPYLRARALVCKGLAASTGGDFAAAVGYFSEALDGARLAKTGLELEARLLAHLADTYLRADNRDLAIAAARDAMDAARRRTDRLAECHASVVSLLAKRTDIPDLADRTAALLKDTGAAVLQSMLSNGLG